MFAKSCDFSARPETFHMRPIAVAIGSRAAQAYLKRGLGPLITMVAFAAGNQPSYLSFAVVGGCGDC